MPPTVALDLALPPTERWRGLAPHVGVARSLVDAYLRDLGLSDEVAVASWAEMLDDYRGSFVRADLAAEIDVVARMIGRSPHAVLVANLYYDLVRSVIGCTAFAIDGPRGPVHARNLDWWTEAEAAASSAPGARPMRLLADGTVVVRVTAAPAGPFETVGWPGFIGVFSGVAKGRFAVTLNAVLSDERTPAAASVALLLRDVFERCTTYADAVRVLTDTPIACDCLLLVTGVRAGELVVIERTPSRAAVRGPQDGVVVVTNDYRAMSRAEVNDGELARTACGRFDRAQLRALAEHPEDAAACFAILCDPEVRMGITVQQMVMHAGSGALEVRIP
jgi:acid ceramidase